MDSREGVDNRMDNMLAPLSGVLPLEGVGDRFITDL
jgi:hypothetical protein